MPANDLKKRQRCGCVCLSCGEPVHLGATGKSWLHDTTGFNHCGPHGEERTYAMPTTIAPTLPSEEVEARASSARANRVGRYQHNVPVRGACAGTGAGEGAQKAITFTALIEVLERLRSKNRNPNREWYNGWNAAVGCLIHDAKAAIAPATVAEGESQATSEQAGGFPWGTRITINGEDYWLNQCQPCASTKGPTYHVIKGEPQPSLNEMMDDEDDSAAVPPTEATQVAVEAVATMIGSLAFNLCEESLDNESTPNEDSMQLFKDSVASIISKYCTADAGEVERLTRELAHATKKWQDYEHDYILPCFNWATECGVDLTRLVQENAGRNCVELLVSCLRTELDKKEGAQ